MQLFLLLLLTYLALANQLQLRKVTLNMITREQLDAGINLLVETVQIELTAVTDALAALQAKVDAGADFTAELAQVTGAKDSLQALVDKLAPAPTPAPEPVVEPTA